MGYGIGGYLALSKQSAFGTPTSSPVYIPFVSESLTENKNLITPENLKNIYDSPNDLQGINNVTGDIVFEPHPIYLGEFLNGAVGPATSTLVHSTYLHEFIPTQTEFATNCTLTPYTITIYKNVGSAYQITDGIIHTLAMEMVAGEIVKCTATVHGRAYAKTAKATPSYINADDSPLVWNQISLQVAGSANGEFESATVTIENPVEGIPVLNNSREEGKILRSDFRTITVDGDQAFDTQTEEGIFRAQTLQRFVFTVTGDVIGTAAEYNQLTIDMPQVRYTTYTYPVAGPGRITAGYEGKAQYDTTSSYAARITLQNTQASY